MSLYYLRKGQRAALEKLGFLAPSHTYATGTHENPRGVPTRTNEDPKTQVNTGFDTFDSALNRDSAMESSQFSVGSGQSTTNKVGSIQQFKAAYSAYKTRQEKQAKKINPTAGIAPAPTLVKLNQLQDRIVFRNLQISIENKAGSFREWYDPNNDEHGKTKMLYPYGYIRMSEGMDGDHVDCFIGPNEKAENVYVITTNKAPDFKVEDEQKCMLGFDSEKQARDIFAKHYTKAGFFRSIKTLRYTDFEAKVLATKDATRKKISFAHDINQGYTAHSNVGPSHDAVPGDYLGLPRASLVGVRSVKGEPMAPVDKISRGFRYMDDATNTTSMDGDTDASSTDPGV